FFSSPWVVEVSGRQIKRGWGPRLHAAINLGAHRPEDEPMVSRKNAFAGFFSRNDHQPARSRAWTKVAVNLEILESRELLNGAHHPRLEQARHDQLEFRKIN